MAKSKSIRAQGGKSLSREAVEIGNRVSKLPRTLQTNLERLAGLAEILDAYGDIQRAHALLMEVHAQANLLANALDREVFTDEDDSIRHGGPELTAKAIKAKICEALHWLEPYDSIDGHEAGQIRYELFDVWNMAALAAHALACDVPLDGEGVSYKPRSRRFGLSRRQPMN